MNVSAIHVVPGRAHGAVRRTALLIALALLLAAPAAVAASDPASPIAAAGYDAPRLYRALGARHLYDTYGHRIFKGKLPPLLYAIAIIETELDADGNVVAATVTREPATAKEVLPWILGLIERASPFPKPGASGMRYQDIWLVDQNYRFQLDSLTEGQQ